MSTTEKAQDGALTPRQASFVREYLIDTNATQAAIRAGYSAKTAAEQASRLLINVKVATAVQKAMDKRAEKLEITADRVLAELAKMAFMDPRKLFAADGSPIAITDLDDDTAASIAGLDVLEEYEGSGQDRKFIGYTKKIKLADKRGALVDLGRHLKLFTDKLEITDDSGLAERMARSRERMKGKT